MPLYLYNTLTRKKEVFTPLRKGRISFYACGPTVYWYAHIGNMRAYIFEDILRRVLEYNGYTVKHVMNYTDVGNASDEDMAEDKMEIGAKRDKKSAWEIADFYIAAFKKDAASLNIKKPTLCVRATDHIKEQIKLVEILEKKGFAYVIDDGVYFDTSKLSDYGKLARLDIKGLKAGARVEQAIGKKNPTDFALWKFSPKDRKREMEWKSPWGKGFPGWHLECSAMSRKYLGEQFDIHAGGVDHIPVHHTNEIAQSEGAFDKIPARYWLHNEFLFIDGNKMSKSLGNLLTLDKIAEKFNPLSFRYLTLTAHYRSPLNLTWESLEGAQSALANLYQKLRELTKETNPFWPWLKLLRALGLAGKKISAALKLSAQYAEKFRERVNDDLDTPGALALTWQMLADETLTATAKKELLMKFDRVLGLGLSKIKLIIVPAHVKNLAQEREIARQNKDWGRADELREQIAKKGWLVEDTPQGPKLTPKNQS